MNDKQVEQTTWRVVGADYYADGKFQRRGWEVQAESLEVVAYCPQLTASMAERIAQLPQLERDVQRYRELIRKAEEHIEWLRSYAASFEVQMANRGWKASASVLAKAVELDAWLAEAALSPLGIAEEG